MFANIGKSKHTEFTFQELFAIIDACWMAKRTTIFTANYAVNEAALRVAQAEADADALCSRMASGKVLVISDVDGRTVHHETNGMRGVA